jgi:hypothetical protein
MLRLVEFSRMFDAPNNDNNSKPITKLFGVVRMFHMCVCMAEPRSFAAHLSNQQGFEGFVCSLCRTDIEPSAMADAAPSPGATARLKKLLVSALTLGRHSKDIEESEGEVL